MTKIYLKYIPIHIHNLEHTSMIMNMKLCSHCFRFHRNINRSENKAKIPLIIHNNEKNKEHISDVQQKIIEFHKLESVFMKRAWAVKIPISSIRAIIKNF